MARPAALIVNPRSGRLSSMAGPAAQLAETLGGAGFVLDPAPAPEASLDEQWGAALAGPAGVIFVAGGDGTLRDAAARLRGTARVFAPLPGGTLNKLCQDLGLPNDPLEAATAYAGAEPGRMDVATANGMIFLHELIMGRASRLVRLRERHRDAGPRGWWPMLQGVLRALWRSGRRDLRLRMGPGLRLRGEAVLVSLPPRGSGRGLLVNLARPGSLWARLRQALRWILGRLREDEEVAVRETPWLVVQPRERATHLSLDGETRLAHGPVRIRLHRDALAVLRIREAPSIKPPPMESWS